MSQPALQLVGAELSHAEAPVAAPEAVVAWAEPTLEQEAQRMAELAGAFALFGLKIDQPEENLWDQSADQPYRTISAAHQAAANDAAAAPAFTFPEIKSRGLHLPPVMPIRLIQTIDWLIVAAAAEFAARWGAGAGLAELSLGAASAFILAALALKAGLWMTEAYRVTPSRIRAERGLGGLALGAILGLAISNFFAPDARSAGALAATIPFAAMLLAGIHAALSVWIRAAHRKGVFSETIVLVGATETAERLAQRAAKSGEARVVAVVDDRLARVPPSVAGAPVSGNLDDLLKWESLPNVDRIVITVTQKAESRVRDIISRLRVAPNRVDLLLDYEANAVRGRHADRFTGVAVACVSGRPHNHARAALKRAQDIIIGSLLLVAFALPMLALAVAVKIDSRGPVLYRQRRHGFNNRIITVLKFRSMRHDPGAALKQVSANDARVTRLGRFMRRTSLDELPQLINVLRGEMSLVGPRAHAVGMKAAERELTQIVAEYAHRHRVKPGITGWAQVNGSRGPIETAAAVRRRLRLDLEYVSRATIWFDLQILLRTFPVLFGDDKATR